MFFTIFLVNIRLMKEENKKFFFTLPVKKQIWYEKGITLCVSGKQKILKTFLKKIKKKYSNIREPTIIAKNKKIEMWFSLEGWTKKQLLSLAKFLNTYNRDRKNKLEYELN